jgi:hypothetical protein
MTIADPAPRPAEALARTEATIAAHPELSALFLRPGEVLYAAPWGVEPTRCTGCDRMIVHVQMCWDHRITSDMHRPGEFAIGEDRFDVWRHIDGVEHKAWQPGDLAPFNYPKYPCTGCGQYDSISTRQEAWGDRVTCTTPGCTYSAWHSIGD